MANWHTSAYWGLRLKVIGINARELPFSKINYFNQGVTQVLGPERRGNSNWAVAKNKVWEDNPGRRESKCKHVTLRGDGKPGLLQVVALGGA